MRHGLSKRAFISLLSLFLWRNNKSDLSCSALPSPTGRSFLLGNQRDSKWRSGAVLERRFKTNTRDRNGEAVAAGDSSVLLDTGNGESIANTNPTNDTTCENSELVAEEVPQRSSTTALYQRNDKEKLPVWPCFDALDRRLIKISVPVIANFAINPIVGAVDLFWVNRMGNALAVAGQAAANQVFNSAFFVTSFLPGVTATLISKENAKGNKEGVQDAISQALFVGLLVAMVTSFLLYSNPEKVLSSVLSKDAPSMAYAKPYLRIRAFACVPACICLVGFSSFRGVLDTVTPVKISLLSNVFHAVLDPILMFALAMGVRGAAMSTLTSEVVAAIAYLAILSRRNMLVFAKLFRLPSWSKLAPILKGGAALQLRNVAMNLTFLSVARVVQGLDRTGVAAAAHAMAIQVFQLGGIVLLALSTVAQTIIPNDLVEHYDENKQRVIGGKVRARMTVNRLMAWGFALGTGLGLLQLLSLPLIRKTTPLQEVRDAALGPSILGSLSQVINGLVFIGEGVMIGTGSFIEISITTVVATIGCLWALKALPPIYGISGVWMAFAVFSVLRLIGVILHQQVYGPLSPRKMKQHNNP